MTGEWRGFPFGVSGAADRLPPSSPVRFYPASVLPGARVRRSAPRAEGRAPLPQLRHPLAILLKPLVSGAWKISVLPSPLAIGKRNFSIRSRKMAVLRDPFAIGKRKFSVLPSPMPIGKRKFPVRSSPPAILPCPSAARPLRMRRGQPLSRLSPSRRPTRKERR